MLLLLLLLLYRIITRAAVYVNLKLRRQEILMKDLVKELKVHTQ